MGSQQASYHLVRDITNKVSSILHDYENIKQINSDLREALDQASNKF
jgi:hypothetical protein